MLASHSGPGDASHLDVGEILHNGEYNVTSKPFPPGKVTAASAFNGDGGAHFLHFIPKLPWIYT